MQMKLYGTRNLDTWFHYLTRTPQQLLLAIKKGGRILHAPDNKIVADKNYLLPRENVSDRWLGTDGQFYPLLDDGETSDVGFVTGISNDIRYATLQPARRTGERTMLDILNKYCREPLNQLPLTFSYTMELVGSKIVMTYSHNDEIEDLDYSLVNDAAVLEDLLTNTIQGDLILTEDDWIVVDGEEIQLGSNVQDLEFIGRDLRVSRYASDVSTMWQ